MVALCTDAGTNLAVFAALQSTDWGPCLSRRLKASVLQAASGPDVVLGNRGGALSLEYSRRYRDATIELADNGLPEKYYNQLRGEFKDPP